jgi:hypothetical protein
MSKLEVNAIEPQSGTTLTVGASGDTIVIPSGATISNQGTAAGFGPTGAVSWNTTKITANPNPAVTGVGYFCDTTSAAFTVTLPSSPAAGAVVGIADYANTFATNNLTVGRNGSNIGGVATNAILSTNGLSVTFVYVDATQGWIVTDSGNRSDLPTPQFVAATGGTIATCGNFKIHTFTGPGTFTVTSAGNASGSNSVDYLVVAGGGGGGGHGGGGGGAGGFRQNFPSPAIAGLPVTATSYPITVGGGGGGGNNANGLVGSDSSFTTIVSTGGGYGSGLVPSNSPGGNGGSGGGGGGSPGSGSLPGGTGNTPPVSPSQGNNGGTLNNPGYAGGGGGGASVVGGDGVAATSGGNGGNGTASSITGSSVTYSGGGGGSLQAPPAGAHGTGGTGGGGNGGASSGGNGSTNTGGGGGGAHNGPPAPGGSGGSGIVVIRYKFQ